MQMSSFKTMPTIANNMGVVVVVTMSKSFTIMLIMDMMTTVTTVDTA